jgi:carbonic anhydrase/acetyltransferase-like protein (isoleucine patch superfamily)
MLTVCVCPGTTIESSCCVVVGYDVKVGKDCFLGHGCSVMGCSVGDSVSIGANACISGKIATY